ncbi:MAG: sialidase family protein [Armatimonadota bacterium]|nr:sialidase family protein [Armatimonadota bacterium]
MARALMLSMAVAALLMVAHSVTADDGGGGEGLRVVGRYVNYFDPQGEIPDVELPELPPPPGAGIEAAPRQVSAGYPDDPYDVCSQRVVRQTGGDSVLRVLMLTRHGTDNLEAYLRYKLAYQVSADDGRSFGPVKPLIQQGDQYDLMHPLEPVRVGKNCAMISSGMLMIEASNGEIMLPIMIPPLDENGEYYNPAGAFTFSDAAVLIGQWVDDATDVIWELGEVVRIDHELSTRGLDEPSIIETTRPGEFLMISRGSNDKRPELPGRKWICTSRDWCRTWTQPQAWTYSDGTPLYSPSAHSVLVRSLANERLYWLGNTCDENPGGNHPRYPLVIGEIDEETLGLIRDTVTVIDTRNPEIDSEIVQLSNFEVRQDEDGRLYVILYRIDYGRRTEDGEYIPDRRSVYVIDVPEE